MSAAIVPSTTTSPPTKQPQGFGSHLIFSTNFSSVGFMRHTSIDLFQYIGNDTRLEQCCSIRVNGIRCSRRNFLWNFPNIIFPYVKLHSIRYSWLSLQRRMNIQKETNEKNTFKELLEIGNISALKITNHACPLDFI